MVGTGFGEKIWVGSGRAMFEMPIGHVNAGAE